MRYFELFNLPTEYQLDMNALQTAYRMLQKQVHPDNFAAGSANDKLLSVQKSSEINDAYQTLKHPLKRAEYMVAEHGFDVRHEQATIRDGQFLMEQMQLREELEEITTADDPDSALEQFYSDVERLKKQYTEQFQTDFASQAFQTSAESVRKLRFIYKLEEEAQRLEDSLFD